MTRGSKLEMFKREFPNVAKIKKMQDHISKIQQELGKNHPAKSFLDTAYNSLSNMYENPEEWQAAGYYDSIEKYRSASR